MQRKVPFHGNFALLLVYLALPVMPGAAEEPPSPTPGSTLPFAGLSEREYALFSLTIEEAGAIDREMERLIRVKPALDQERRRALGILHIARYIRGEQKEDALEALEILEELPADTHLRMAYLGVAHAFVARIRTIFGVKNLEAMQEILESIPEQLDDPLVRFLRGNTLVPVGRALPGVFTIKEIKERAIAVGTADLEYILQQEPGTVRKTFTDQARKVLSGP